MFSRILKQNFKQTVRRGFAVQTRIPSIPNVNGMTLIPLIAVGVLGAVTVTRYLIEETRYQQRNWSNPDYVIDYYNQN